MDVMPVKNPMAMSTQTPTFAFLLSCISHRNAIGNVASNQSIKTLITPLYKPTFVPTSGGQHRPGNFIFHCFANGLQLIKMNIKVGKLVKKMKAMRAHKPQRQSGFTLKMRSRNRQIEMRVRQTARIKVGGQIDWYLLPSRKCWGDWRR